MNTELDISGIFDRYADQFRLKDGERESGRGIMTWFGQMHRSAATRCLAVSQSLLPSVLAQYGNLRAEDPHLSTGLARAILSTFAEVEPDQYACWRDRALNRELWFDLMNPHIKWLRAASRNIKANI